MQKPNKKTVCSSPRTLGVALAGLLLGCVSTLAQVQIPASYMASPSDYNSASTNFVMRVYQTVTNSPNTIQGALDRLDGVYGPNIATNGPNADGSYNVPYIDHDVADGSFTPGDSVFFPGYNNLPYPGVDNTAGAGTNITVEVIGYLNLPAGVHTLGVRANDTFRLTIGKGGNPYDAFALQPDGAIRSPGGNTQDNLFSFEILSAGVYPVRMIHGQGAGAGTIELYYTNKTAFGPGFGTLYLVNDPFDANNSETIVAFAPASLPITPTQAYVSSITPASGAVGVSPQPQVVAQLVDAGTTVNTNTISVTVDGNPVALDISQDSGVTTISGQVTNLLDPFQVVPLTLVFEDSSATVISNSFNFTVINYFPIPASYAYPGGSGDSSKRGFVGNIRIARANQSFNASIGRADAHLQDLLVDAGTGLPYENLVQTAANNTGLPGVQLVNADGTYVNTNVINYSIQSAAPNAPYDIGFFTTLEGYADTNYPGLPGFNTDVRDPLLASNARFLSWEEYAWVELPAGLIEVCVYGKDAVQIAVHQNNPRDLFREAIVQFDTNAGNGERTRLVYVETAGVYGFRVAQAEFDADPQIEFYTRNPNTPNVRHLVNDASDGSSVAAYQEMTVASRPYIQSVSPSIGASGVALSEPIVVKIADLGTNAAVLDVDGAPVVLTSSNLVGNITTLTYAPSGGWQNRIRVVDVDIHYGASTGSWSFQTLSGVKAWVVGLSGGDTQVAQRLAQVFKLDVSNIAESSVTAADITPDLTFIWNSEAVSSGATLPYINGDTNNPGARFLPIAVINVEQGNADEFFPGAGGNQSAIGAAFWSIAVTNAASPLAAGLSGTNLLLNPGSGGRWHRATVPAYATGNVGTSLDGDGRSIFGVEAGVDSGVVVQGGTNYIFPARRVQFPIAGPGMIDRWNDNAWALFDASVAWVLPPVFMPPQAVGGGMRIQWVGVGATLQERTDLTTGSWVNSANQANPQVVPVPGGQKFFRLVK